MPNFKPNCMSRKIYLALFSILFFASQGFAQVGSGSLQGKLTDTDTGEPLPFVNIVVFLNGSQVTGSNTDFDGNYTVKPLQPGTYDVLYSYVGYNSKQISGVKVNANKITFQDMKLSSGIQLEEVEIVEYKTPLIDKDGGASGGTVTKEDIDKMPGRTAESIAVTVAGVNDAGTGGGISVRGARTDGTWYYIDGIKVRGSTALPKAAIEEISVITGGVPANYGDATGGIINITTRGASSFYFGGIEMITSGFKSGNQAVGLDHFGYNLLEGFLSGPLFWKKDAEGKRDRPLLGFFISGNYNSQVDPRATFGGVYKIKDEALDAILTNPISPFITDQGEVNGTNRNAEFLLADDFEKVNTRLNANSTNMSLAGKIDVTTTPTINLTFGGSANYNRSNAYSYANSLMNWNNNAEVTQLDWRVYGRFSQRFIDSDEEGEASPLKNVYYSVMVDYSKTTDLQQDRNHQDDYFKYGHVGTFKTYDRLPFAPVLDQFGNLDYYERDGEFEEIYVEFTPSEYNPDLAAINNQYFGLFPNEYLTQEQIEFYQAYPNTFVEPGAYTNLLAVQQGGAILNGNTPNGVYNLWTFPGTPNNGYSKFNNSQFRISASGSADIGDHAIQLGFEYEQRRDAGFSLAPAGLWTLARLNTNFHIQEIDTSSIDYQFLIGQDNYVVYNRLITPGDQRLVDRNLRTALGLNPFGDDFINIDELDPNTFTLDMFSADELLNGGNSVVGYYGYNHYGDKVSGNSSLNDFFTQRDDNGFLTRPMAPYEPIYLAGYIMDKFAFDDIIFNVGLRIDQFDANQPIPKDPFVIGEAFTASEVTAFGSHPENIGDDFVVYVDNLTEPSNITGYRDEQTWYNSQGTQIDDPSLIATDSDNPTPYLKDLTIFEGGFEGLTPGAFQDYKPQVNIMPRIAFSFPISDEALFFAHYDILTQRPTESNRFNPIDFLFMDDRNALIGNPALKPTKTIDYELGFQQVLSRTSSLKISAFYRELRDMIQVRNFSGAYPRQYRAFGNLDFGTVKGLSLSYDLRRTGNVWMRASYTLQFADGTGSNSQTALALINAGLPNLRNIAPFDYDQRHRVNVTVDYRYGEGSDYNGPVWFGKQVLSNTGVNFIGNLGSGVPYTASAIAYPVTGEVSPTTDGSINGSRLPWQFSLSAQLDRNFTLKFGGEGDKAKTANLNIYLWVNNVLNTQNILGVYRFTGVSDDDGYLATAQYQPQINSQISPSSFRNYYSMYVDNPFNLGAPRTIRLGVKLDF